MESNSKKTLQSKKNNEGGKSVPKKVTAKKTQESTLPATPVEREVKPVDVVERLKNVLTEVQGSLGQQPKPKAPKTAAKEKALPKKASDKPKAKKVAAKAPAKKSPLEKKKVDQKKSAIDLLETLNAKAKKPIPTSKKGEQKQTTSGASNDVERLKNVISAGKKLQQIMEVKDLKVETKERALREKLTLVQRLEEESPEEVSLDELEQEQDKVRDLNEKIAILQQEKAQLDSAIMKVLAAKVNGIPVIDQETLGLSPSVSSGVLVDQQKEVSQSTDSISEIEEVLTSLEKQHQENQLKLEIAEQANQQLMDQMGRQAVVVNDLEKEVVSLRGEVLNEKTISQQMKTQLENEQKNQEKHQKEIEQLKKQVELSKEQIAQAKATLKDEMAKKVQALDKQYQEEKKEVARLQKQLQSTTKAMETQKAKEEDAKEKLLEEKKASQKFSKEVESLKATLEKMQANAQEKKPAASLEEVDFKKVQKGLKKEIANLKSSMEKQKTKEQQVKDALTAEKRASRRLQKQIETLQSNLEKQKASAVPTDRLIALDSAFQEEKKETTRLQKSIATLTCALEELKAKEAAQKSELEQIKKENARLMKESEQIKTTFEDLKAKSIENKKLYDEEKRLSTKYNKRLESSKQSNRKLQSVIREYKKQEAQQMEKDAQKEQLLENEKAEKAQVEKQLEQLRLEVDGLVSSIQELRQTNETLANRDLEESTVYEQENQKLQMENKKISDENERLFALVDDLRMNNEQLKNQSLALAKRIDLELESQKHDFESLKQEKHQLQAKYDELLKESEQVKAQFDASLLSKELSNENEEQVTVEVSQLKETNHRLQLANTDLTTALDLLKSKYAELEKALEKERYEKSQMQGQILQTRDDPTKVASLISELNKTQDLIKSKELEIEILKSSLFREQNRVVHHDPYQYYGYDYPRYQQAPPYSQPTPVEPKIQPAVIDQQEKQSLLDEIKALKTEISKMKDVPVVDSSALINEFREELLRNREDINRLTVQKQKEIQEISDSYETKLQSNELEKDELREQNRMRMQQINELLSQVSDKEYTLQNLKNAVRKFSEEDIFDPEFKRRIRVIRDMQKEIKERLEEETLNHNSAIAAFNVKITQRKQDIEKLNARIDQLTDTFNANRDFTASTKEAYEKAKAKALLELQLQQERLFDLEDDLEKQKNKYQMFVTAKEQELSDLKTKEGQIIEYYLRKIRQEYSLSEDYQEIKQVETERDQLLDQINELKASQEQTTETIVKQSEELTKVVTSNQNLQKQLLEERKAKISKQAEVIEANLQDLNREQSEYTRKLNDLKVELDKRLEYEKRLRLHEEKVSDYFNNKLLLEQCLSDFSQKSKQMDAVLERIESIGNEPAAKTDLLRAKAEVTDLEVHRDDLRSKIDFCRKNLKDLEANPTVVTYMKLINQIDQIRNVQKELKGKLEPVKEAILVKTKELDALMKEKSEIV